MGVVAAGLGLQLGDEWLFREIELVVPPGTAVALTGPNGTGKSTLLRLLYGLQHPTEGSLTVCGQVPDERSFAFRRDVSVLLDDSDLFIELSPRQHLELLRDAYSFESDVDELLAYAELDHRADVAAGSLSAGQRRRLLLLGATARPHKVLLLDEPERAIDAAGRDWLTDLVSDAKADGSAVVLATHHPPLHEVCDAVLTLG